MNGPEQTVSACRVVVLSREPGLISPHQAAASGGRCVRVDSAYEAAAEILAAAPAALVVDLRALSSDHVRLLEIARQAAVALYVTGTVRSGLDADALDGATFVRRSELSRAIAEVLAARRPDTEAPAAPAVVLVPAKAAPDPEKAREPAAEAEAAEDASGSFQSRPPSSLLKSIEDMGSVVLTPEELSALLEDEA